MSEPAAAVEPAARIYGTLMARAAGAGNDHALACMIASSHMGGGSLPPRLGLSPAPFQCLMEHHFPETTLSAPGPEA